MLSTRVAELVGQSHPVREHDVLDQLVLEGPRGRSHQGRPHGAGGDGARPGCRPGPDPGPAAGSCPKWPPWRRHRRPVPSALRSPRWRPCSRRRRVARARRPRWWRLPRRAEPRDVEGAEGVELHDARKSAMSSGALSRESVRPPAPPPATLITTARGAAAVPPRWPPRHRGRCSRHRRPRSAAEVPTSSLPASRARSKTTTCIPSAVRRPDGRRPEAAGASGDDGGSLIPLHCFSIPRGWCSDG